MVLASTHERILDVVPLNALREHAVDVPDDLAAGTEITPKRLQPQLVAVLPQ